VAPEDARVGEVKSMGEYTIMAPIIPTNNLVWVLSMQMPPAFILPLALCVSMFESKVVTIPRPVSGSRAILRTLLLKPSVTNKFLSTAFVPMPEYCKAMP